MEDDPDAIFVYQEVLDLKYNVYFLRNLEEFQQRLQELRQKALTLPNLLVADLRLPDGNFIDFLADKDIALFNRIPFLVVSSCNDIDILRNCFEEGATDYLTKPFTKSELVVKIERFLKLDSSRSYSVETNGDIVFDPSALAVKGADDVIAQLTAKELQLFSILYRANGKKVNRQQIQTEIWKNAVVTPKTLDVHLFNLRKKLFKLSLEIKFIPPDNYVLLSNRMNTDVKTS